MVCGRVCVWAPYTMVRVRGHPCGVSPLLSYRVWRLNLGNQAQQQVLSIYEPLFWLTNEIILGQWHARCHVHVTMAEWSGYGRIHEIQYVFKIFSKNICKVRSHNDFK